MSPYPRYHIGRLAKVGAALHCVRLRQVVFDKTQADVVAHLVQLPVHFSIVALVVFAELCHYRTIGQGNQLGVDFIDTRPREYVRARTCR